MVGISAFPWGNSDGMYGGGFALQEIPKSFAAETGWPGAENCALVTSISTLKEWPLQIRRLHGVCAGVAAVSVGNGWAKFVEDQKLGVGAFLTFEVVDERRLVVALHNRRSPKELRQPEAIHGDNALLRDLLDRDLHEAGDPRRTPSHTLSEAHGGERTQFRKTLRKTHTQKGESNRMVSAVPPSTLPVIAPH